MKLKRCFLLVAKYTGLFGLSRRLTARKVRILAYHGIWLGERHFGDFLYMDRHRFAARMALLKRWNYPIVPLQKLSEGIENLPDAATVITIDDGWYGSYKYMVPTLESHDFPATIYLTTYYSLHNHPVANVALQYCLQQYTDNQHPARLHLTAWQVGPLPLTTSGDRADALNILQEKLNNLENDQQRQAFLQAVAGALNVDLEQIIQERWFHLMAPAEVSDAARRGIAFELHTHRHRIAEYGASCLTEEIRLNREAILRLTGQTAKHFCYPSGIYTPDIWPELEACEVVTATTTEIGLVDPDSKPYALPRILDGQSVSDLEFEAEMSGFLELVRRVRQRFH